MLVRLLSLPHYFLKGADTLGSHIAITGEMSLVTSLSTLLPSEPSASVTTIDLSGLKWVRPIFFTYLMAFISRWSDLGLSFEILAPCDAGVKSYLSRMNLGRHLTRYGIPHDIPEVNQKQEINGETLAPLTEVISNEDLTSIIRIIHQRVSDNDLKEALCDIVVEASTNIAHHSGANRGYVAAQLNKKPGGSDFRLSLSVSDAGSGMLHTLRDRGARSEAQALELGLTGMSRLDDPNRGEGLPRLRLALERAHGNGQIVSGNATMNMATLRPWIGNASSLRGTSIDVDIPAELNMSTRMFHPRGKTK